MDNQSTIKGVRIRTFNRCIMVLSCILFILILFTTASIPAKYHQLIQHTEEYISCEPDVLPQEVRDMPLTAADAALERGAMIEKACSLVFDEGYQDAKALIYSHLSHFTATIMDATRQRQANSETVLLRVLSGQRIFISVLFVITLINFLVIAVLIIRPLSIHISHIKENKALEIVGSYEFKYLALTYNDIYKCRCGIFRAWISGGFVPEGGSNALSGKERRAQPVLLLWMGKIQLMILRELWKRRKENDNSGVL